MLPLPYDWWRPTDLDSRLWRGLRIVYDTWWCPHDRLMFWRIAVLPGAQAGIESSR